MGVSKGLHPPERILLLRASGRLTFAQICTLQTREEKINPKAGGHTYHSGLEYGRKGFRGYHYKIDGEWLLPYYSS